MVEGVRNRWIDIWFCLSLTPPVTFDASPLREAAFSVGEDENCIFFPFWKQKTSQRFFPGIFETNENLSAVPLKLCVKRTTPALMKP